MNILVEDMTIAVRGKMTGNYVAIISGGPNDDDGAKLGCGTNSLSREGFAVMFANSSGCELTVAFVAKLGVSSTVETDGDEMDTALAGRLSALMMSAAFGRIVSYDQCRSRQIDGTFSATPYTTACKCAAGIIGKIPASTTLKF